MGIKIANFSFLSGLTLVAPAMCWSEPKQKNRFLSIKPKVIFKPILPWPLPVVGEGEYLSGLFQFCQLSMPKTLWVRLRYPKPMRTEADNILKDTATDLTAETIGI